MHLLYQCWSCWIFVLLYLGSIRKNIYFSNLYLLYFKCSIIKTNVQNLTLLGLQNRLQNHRPCLKSKPQVKCHWSFRVGQTSEDEGHSRRTFDSRHSPQDKPRKATHARPEPPTPDTAHKLPNILERANLALPPAFHSKHKALWFSWILFK